MPEKQSQSYRVLAATQAAAGIFMTVVILALYKLWPELLPDTGILLSAAALGALGAIYYFTIHRFLARTKLSLSTLILTIITAVSFILIIASTGGIDSPFY